LLSIDIKKNYFKKFIFRGKVNDIQLYHFILVEKQIDNSNTKRKININNCLRSCLNFYFPFFLKTAKNIDLKFYLKKNIKREIKKENVLNFIIFMSKNYFNKSEEISIKFNPN